MRGKSAAGKSLFKCAKCAGSNRFRGDHGRGESGEVKSFDFLILDLAQAQLIPEVGTGRVRPAVARGRFQPASRPLQESRRRHQHAEAANVSSLHDLADQPQVMKNRKPGDSPLFFGGGLGDVHNPIRCHQVGVGDRNSFRLRGRSRGVLDQRQGGVPLSLQRCRRESARLHAVGWHPLHRFKFRGGGKTLLDRPKRLIRGQSHSGPRIAHDPPKALEGSGTLVNDRGNCGRTGVKTTQKCRDKVRTGRVNQQDTLTLAHLETSKFRSNRRSPGIKLCERKTL